MKKILLFFVFSFFVFSCNKDDDNDCKCYAKFSRFGSNGTYFYIPDYPIDCNTRRPLFPPPANEDAIFIGCEERF